MRGGEIQTFDRQAAVAQLAGPDVFVGADLHLGSADYTVYTTDLSMEYVRLNMGE